MEAETQTDALACPGCGKREDLVVTGIAVAAILNRYESDNDCTWAVKCWGCGESMRINDAARDELFGTGWRRPEAQEAGDE